MSGHHAARRTSLLARLCRRPSAQPRKLVWVGMPGYQAAMWYTPSAPPGRQWETAGHEAPRPAAARGRHAAGAS